MVYVHNYNHTLDNTYNLRKTFSEGTKKYLYDIIPTWRKTKNDKISGQPSGLRLTSKDSFYSINNGYLMIDSNGYTSAWGSTFLKDTFKNKQLQSGYMIATTEDKFVIYEGNKLTMYETEKASSIDIGCIDIGATKDSACRCDKLV